jgi:ABC-2 type transport system ATP-binding protein
VSRQAGETLRITGVSSDTVGELARANGLTLLELSAHQASLEDRYMELTSDSADYRMAEGALARARN